jgi:hypothetical protein
MRHPGEHDFGTLLHDGRQVETPPREAYGGTVRHAGSVSDRPQLATLATDIGALVAMESFGTFGLIDLSGGARHPTFGTTNKAHTLLVDSALGPMYLASQLNQGGYFDVSNYTTLAAAGDPGSTFTYMGVFMVANFHSEHILVDRGGSSTGALNFVLTDGVNNGNLQLRRSADGLVVFTSTAISDIWKLHFYSVSCGGNTGTNCRLMIDGDYPTLTMTARTPSAVSRFRVGPPPNSVQSVLHIPFFAYWQSQISVADERYMWEAFKERRNYRPKPRLYGVHTGHSTYSPSQQDLLNRKPAEVLGARCNRANAAWDQIEAVQGTYDTSRIEKWAIDCLASGQEPVVCFVGSPTWANGGASTFHVPNDMSFTGAFITANRAFVAHLVPILKRIGVKYYEVGNEPNFGSTSAGFWRYTSSMKALADWATDYMTWACAIGEEIRWAQPDARICFGSLASYQAIGTGHAGNAFLDACSAVATYWDYALILFDALSVHPYPYGAARRGPRTVLDQDNNLSDWRKARNQMWRLGMGDMTLWITETGWFTLWSSGTTGDQTVDQTTTQQADVTNWVGQLLSDIRDYGSEFVELVVYFLADDRPNSYIGIMTGLNAAGGGFVDYNDTVQAGSTRTEIRVGTLPSAPHNVASRVFLYGDPAMYVDYTGTASAPNRLTGCTGPGVRVTPKTGAAITNTLGPKRPGVAFRDFVNEFSA